MLRPKISKIRNYCLVKHLLIYSKDLRQNNIKIQVLLNVKSPTDPRKDSVQLTVDKFSLQLNVINEIINKIITEI